MANTYNGSMWKLDTVDVISTSPVIIKKIVLIPNAASDAATFVSWGAQSTPELAVATATTTVTGTNTLTSTANFETDDVDPLDILTITKASSGNNLGSYMILTNSSDNVVTVTAGSVANEAGVVYDYDVFTPYTSMYIESNNADIVPIEMDFGSGRQFKNLALSVLTSSAVVYIYL